METRSKKKCKQAAAKDGNPLINSAQERFLPPEIMEIIIKNLNEQPRELMTYRLVNSYWASVIDSYLEREVLSNWRNWDDGLNVDLEPSVGWLIVDPPPVPLSVFSVVSSASSPSAQSPSVYFPKKLFNHDRNPFPARSLTISLVMSSQSPIRLRFYDEHRECGCVKIEKLLFRFGHHLTSFVFQHTMVTFPQLERILAALPNLKAFTISSITLRKSSKKVEGSMTSLISSQLTHLRAVKCVSPQIIQWLVDRCAHQLVSLDVDAAELKPFNGTKTESSSPVPYKELEYLKLYNPSRTFLQLTEEFPLKYLSIIYNKTHTEQKQEVLPRDVKKFGLQFVKTLVELNLQLNWDEEQMSLKAWEDDETEEYLVEKHPKLVKCSFRCPPTSWFGDRMWKYFYPDPDDNVVVGRLRPYRFFPTENGDFIFCFRMVK